jgi:hypothetical protein
MESITRYLASEQVGIWRHHVSKAHGANQLTVASVIYYLLNAYGRNTLLGRKPPFSPRTCMKSFKGTKGGINLNEIERFFSSKCCSLKRSDTILINP